MFYVNYAMFELQVYISQFFMSQAILIRTNPRGKGTQNTKRNKKNVTFRSIINWRLVLDQN
jgi:hypothetical protein